MLATSASACASVTSASGSGPRVNRKRLSAPMTLPRRRSGSAHADSKPAPTAYGAKFGHRSRVSRRSLWMTGCPVE